MKSSPEINTAASAQSNAFPDGETADMPISPSPVGNVAPRELLSKNASAPSTELMASFSHRDMGAVEHQDGVLLRIDPNRIRVMQIPNRDALAFDSDEFEDLHQNILVAGGNTVPISVVQLEKPTAEADFELIAGERRMRACLQAKLPVLAIVKQSVLVPARQRMLETVRENLARQNLSPYEFGRQLKHVINAGLSPSARALGRDIGRHHGDVSAAIKLASLPDEVIEAFTSTADLQYRFEGPLSQALAKNQGAVLKAALGIKAMQERPPAKEVLALLVTAASTPLEGVKKGAVGPSDSQSRGAICCRGEEVGSVRFDRRGQAKITLEVALTGKQQAALHKHINAFVQRHMADAANSAGDGHEAKPITESAPTKAKQEDQR